MSKQLKINMPSASDYYGGYANPTIFELETKHDRTDPSTWKFDEQIKFLIWNAQTQNPEAVEQFQALQDIARKIELEEEMERHRQELEFRKQISDHFAKEREERKFESIWDAMKRIAGYGK